MMTASAQNRTLLISMSKISGVMVNTEKKCTSWIKISLYSLGTHGVSMGSIGQYAGVQDIIENVYIENVTMLNAQVCNHPLISFLSPIM